VCIRREDIDTVLCKHPKWGNFDLVKCGDSMINNMEKLPLLWSSGAGKNYCGETAEWGRKREREREERERERDGVLMLYDNNYSSIIDLYF
jgi:hypothetical protein